MIGPQVSFLHLALLLARHLTHTCHLPVTATRQNPAIRNLAVYRRRKYYESLVKFQQDALSRHTPPLRFASRHPQGLPSFAEKLIILPEFLPEYTFHILRDVAISQPQQERSYIPGHKKGGTVAYEVLYHTAPEIVAFYHSPGLQQLCSAIIGERVVPTPIHDQSSCSLLFYDQPGDWIGWHYDYNFYNGRHFTALLSLVNEHRTEQRLSAGTLVIKKNGCELEIPTSPNTFVLFEGAFVYHKVMPVGHNEQRLMLSMTFCTDQTTSLWKSVARRVKDIGYFGIRALWT